MLTPFPTQISGARFLSARRNALLADEQRVGKTGTAILSADDNLDASICVVTTASGRPVWERAFPDWSPFKRSLQVMAKPAPANSDVVIVGWNGLTNPKIRHELLKRNWDRLILDESHFAKSLDAARTMAVYGEPVNDGRTMLTKTALVSHAKGVWCLSGTPGANSPLDLYAMMRALCPERLEARGDWPDVTTFTAFRDRYTKWRPKKISRWRSIIVVMGGKNEAELRARLGDFMLRRTQADVGIRQPIYETFPMLVTPKMLREANGDLDKAKIIEAAERGSTRDLEMQLGPIRRVTGAIKAHAVVQAVKDEFEGGLDKIVIAFWHKEVGQILKDGLSSYGVVGIDGSTPPDMRGQAEQRFLKDPKIRVFLGQIQAAGEAIDLSSSSELLFAETSLVPAQMAQMSKRITNYSQKGTPRCRVATLAGSIDEALEQILMRKWSAIREVVR